MIRWGVIGCGGIAYRRTIPGMMLSANSELYAVMDSSPAASEQVKAEFGAKYACTTAEELLALDEVDAVYIASPVFCHRAQAMAAADAGKHILLEKPLGLTVAEAEEIAAYCRARGVKLGVGLMMRFSAYHQKMRELIAAGTLGEIVSMRAQLTCWYPDIPGAWRQDKALSGGGALMDMGIHCIDLLQYISGTRVSSLSCFAQTQTFSYSTEDSAALLVKMDSGATAFVDANFNIPDEAAECRMEFYGTKGSLLARGTIGQTESGEVILTAPEAVGGYDAAQERTAGVARPIAVDCGNMYEKEITAFANAILTDTEPPIPAQDGIFVQRIVERAYEASETGRVVKM